MSTWIDVLRWTAAASVLLTHIGLRFVPAYHGQHLPAWQVFYLFLAGFDHQAVLVFFVLSGWLIGGAVLREAGATGHFDWSRYLTRRLTRLCIVVWPALGLAGLCAIATARPADTSTPTLVCNMLFLQTALCPQYAGNGPLWSLFNEFWYYAAFPMVVLAGAAPSLRSRLAWATCGAGLLGGLTWLQFTGAPLAPYAMVWLAGAAATTLSYSPLRPLPAAWLLGGALLAIRLGVRRDFAMLYPAGQFGLDLLVGILVALLLASLAAERQLPPAPGAALHRSLAGFSFTLYCTHAPVLDLIQTWGGGLASPAALAGASWVVCLGLAWAISRVTEARTDAVRDWFAAFRPGQAA